jgi:hypothetical protein
MTFRAELCPFILPIPVNWIHDGWIAFIIGAMAKVGLLDRSTVKYRQHPVVSAKLSLKFCHKFAEIRSLETGRRNDAAGCRATACLRGEGHRRG